MAEDDKPKVKITQVQQAPVKNGVVQDFDPKPFPRKGLDQSNPQTHVVKDTGEPLATNNQGLKTKELDYGAHGEADVEKYTVTDQYGNRAQNNVIPLSPPRPEEFAVIDQPGREHNIRPDLEGGPVGKLFVDEYGNRGYKEAVHSPTSAPTAVQPGQVDNDTVGKVKVISEFGPEDTPPDGLVEQPTLGAAQNYKKNVSTKGSK